MGRRCPILRSLMVVVSATCRSLRVQMDSRSEPRVSGLAEVHGRLRQRLHLHCARTDSSSARMDRRLQIQNVQALPSRDSSLLTFQLRAIRAPLRDASRLHPAVVRVVCGSAAARYSEGACHPRELQCHARGFLWLAFATPKLSLATALLICDLMLSLD